MVAFATLAAVLAQALEHATGSSALDSAEFVPLVNAILPVVRDIAERTTGRRLAEPNSPEARRKYLKRMSPDRLRTFAERSGRVDRTSTPKR
jgi:hypothetical protein